MNKAITNFLNKSLGVWIEDLNSEQFNLSIFSGKLLLTDLKLKSDFLDILGLPFHLSSGTVKKIEAKIPWSSLYSSPLKLTISDVNLLLRSIPTESWSFEKEKNSVMKTRKYYLDSFELLNPDDFEMSSSESSGGLFASKLLDNLELRVENVYIRYEDQSGFRESFVFGALIKEAVMFNCNRMWEQEFSSGENVFKLMQISESFLFIDYEDGIVLCKEWFEGEIQECLWELSREEVQGKIHHKYLVAPTEVRIEIVVNKQESRVENPLYSVNCDLDSIKLELFVAQVEFLLGIKKFVNEHFVFKKSIEKGIVERSFKHSEVSGYRKAYLEYRNAVQCEESSEEIKGLLLRNLEVLEEGIYLDDIKIQRKSVIDELKLKKLENAKKEEINKMNGLKKQGSMKTLWRFLSIRSKSEIEVEQQHFDEKLKTAEMDLARIEQRSCSVVRKITRANTSKLEFMTDRVEYFISLNFKSFFLNLQDDEQELTNLEFSNLRTEISFRLASSKYFLKSKKLIVKSKLVESIFSALIQISVFEIIYDSSDNKQLSLKSEDLVFFIDLYAISRILSVLQNLFNKNKTDEDSESSLKTDEDVWQLYSVIQNYLEYGVINKYNVEIQLKNTTVCMPIEAKDLNLPVLMLNVKGIITLTEKRIRKGLGFEVYTIAIKEFTIYAKYEHYEEALIESVSINTILHICNTRQFVRSGFMLEIDFSPLRLNLTEKNLLIFWEMFKILEKHWKESEESSEYGQELELFVKGLGDVIKTKIFFKFSLISVGFSNFFVVGENIEGRFKFNKMKIVFLVVRVKELCVMESGDEILKVKEDEEKEMGVKFVFSYQPADNLQFYSVKVSESHCLITAKLLKTLKSYNSSYQLSQKATKHENLVSNKLKTYNFKLSFHVSSFNLKLQTSKPKHWNTIKINSALSISSTLNDKSQLEYHSGIANIAQKVIKSLTETSVLVSNVKIALSNYDQEKTICDPFRLHLENFQDFSSTSPPLISNCASIDQIRLKFGFRDLDFLQFLYSEFFTFTFESPSQAFTSTNLLEINSCQLIIIEDTVSEPIPLLNCSFKELLVTYSENLVLTTGEIITKYFDKALKTWQLFQDYWKFIIKSSTTECGSEVQLSGESSLNLFINPNICETLGILQTRIYQTSDDWEEPYSYPQEIKEHLDFQITNNFGISVYIWVQIESSTKYYLEPFTSCLLKYSEIQNLYIKSNKKKIQFFEESLKICVEIPGFGVISDVYIQDEASQVFSIGLLKLRKDLKKSENFIQIVLLSAFCILNETEVNLIVGFREEDFLVQDFFSVPILWNIEEVYIEYRSNRIGIMGSEFIQVAEGKFIGCDQSSFVYNDKIYEGVLVRSPYIIRNLLPYDIDFCIEKFENVHVGTGKTGKCFGVGIINMQIRVRIEVGDKEMYTESFKIDSVEQEVKILCEYESYIIIMVKDFSKSCIEVEISCKYCLVNFLKHSLILENIVLPQDSVSFYRSHNKTTIIISALQENLEYENKRLDIETLGLAESLTLKSKNNTFTYVGVLISMPNPQISLKIINFYPSFHIKNELSTEIYIRQYSSKKAFASTKLLPNESLHFSFNHPSKKKAVQVSENNIDWSPGFLIDQLNDFQIKFKSFVNKTLVTPRIFEKDPFWYLPSRENFYFYHARVTVFTQNQACIHALIRNPTQPDFQIYNNTDFDLSIKQFKSNSQYLKLVAGARMPFVYQNFFIPKKKVLIKFEGFKQKFSLENFKAKYKKLAKFSVNISTSDNTRILEIFTENTRQSFSSTSLLSQLSKITKKTYIFTCKHLNFAFCDKNFIEHSSATLENLHLKYTQSQRQISKNLTIDSSFDLRIEDFQLDNMLTSPNLFPVIAARAIQDNSTPFFQLLYNRCYSNTQSSNFTSKDTFPSFEMQIQPITLNIDYETFQSMHQLQKEYTVKYYSSFIPDTSQSELPFFSSFPNPDSLKTYFEFIRVHSLDIILTFRKPNTSEIFQHFSPVAKTLTNKFLDYAKVTNSPLHLKEVIIQHSFQDRYTIFWALLKNYSRQSMMQFYKVLGATQILGNPIGLIDKLGTGVYEFITAPAKGMLHSYKGFLNGVSKGTKSLVGNFVEGGFGSVAGITSSLYYIVSEEHSGKNEIFDKLGLYDLENGFRNLTYRPYKGFKEHGIRGLVKELSLGLCSASLAPLSALLHLTHTISSQIANEGKKLSGSNLVQRLRPLYLLTPSKQFVSVGNMMEVAFSGKIQLRDIKLYLEFSNEQVLLTKDSIIVVFLRQVTRVIPREGIKKCEVYFCGERYVLVIYFRERVERLFSNQQMLLIKLYYALV